MNLSEWYQKRGIRFLWQRGRSLVSRYGMTSSKAASRIVTCINALAPVNCSPTFPVPGIVVKHYPDFMRSIQELGAEIAVHGYNHVDLTTYPTEKSCEQLLRAANLFQEEHLVASGFRCPYLSCSDELINMIPPGVFKYSSNKAVSWDYAISKYNSPGLLARTINGFYKPQNAAAVVCAPWKVNGMVEIPVCVPDDLQLIDGYRLAPGLVAETWIHILKAIHHRGELFNLLFHPELGAFTTDQFLEVLAAARQLKPKVWIARLAEIADWWIEKSGFSHEWNAEDGEFQVRCTSRATILGRGLPVDNLERIGSYEPWDERYVLIKPHCFTVSKQTRPMVGISSNVPVAVKNFLIEQGYLIDSSDQAFLCSIFLDADNLKKVTSPVDLIDFIENSDGPLVRIWRWPDGCKCAFSVSGDLDALSLMDYAARLFVR